MKHILYLHGMGGGEDSRIPSILKTILPEGVSLTVRIYDFDPDLAKAQIKAWCSELRPDLIVGESLGALHALRIPDLPKILVSPALGAPRLLNFYAWISLIPGVTPLLDHIYRPTRPGRQKLHFTFKVLRKYPAHGKAALEAPQSYVYAFIGLHDHYRRYGVVSVSLYRKHFGETFSRYDGCHFMEEEYVRTILIEKILEVLDVK